MTRFVKKGFSVFIFGGALFLKGKEGNGKRNRERETERERGFLGKSGEEHSFSSGFLEKNKTERESCRMRELGLERGLDGESRFLRSCRGGFEEENGEFLRFGADCKRQGKREDNRGEGEDFSWFFGFGERELSSLWRRREVFSGMITVIPMFISICKFC